MYIFVKQLTVATARTAGHSVRRMSQQFVQNDVHMFTDSTHHGYDVTVVIDDVMPIVYLARLSNSASAISPFSHGRTDIIDLKITG
jgi:hypothetical protein